MAFNLALVLAFGGDENRGWNKKTKKPQKAKERQQALSALQPRRQRETVMAITHLGQSTQFKTHVPTARVWVDTTVEATRRTIVDRKKRKLAER